MIEEVKIPIKELLRLQQFEKDNLCNVQSVQQKEAVRDLTSKIAQMRSANGHLRDWNKELQRKVQLYKELEEVRLKRIARYEEVIQGLKNKYEVQKITIPSPRDVLKAIGVKFKKP